MRKMHSQKTLLPQKIYFSVHYTQNIIHEIPLPVSVNRQGDERIRLFYFVPLHSLETIMIRISPITSIPIKIRYGMV